MQILTRLDGGNYGSYSSQMVDVFANRMCSKTRSECLQSFFLQQFVDYEFFPLRLRMPG